MLIAFLKSHNDKYCQCEIVKYCDRIWLEQSGNLICIRTMIISVKDNSPPLHEIRMVMPFRQISELIDISDTCLKADYLFNTSHYSTGGYHINSLDIDYGSVYYDFFETDVFLGNMVKEFKSPTKAMNYNIISIAFKDEFKENSIKPGTFRLIRIKFKITSMLDEVHPRLYSLELDYFDMNLIHMDYDILDFKNLEIPVKVLFNSQTKQGGFDIFLYLPDNLHSSIYNAYTNTRSSHLSDGLTSTRKNQKLIWRAREFYHDREYLRLGENPFSAECLINDPFELEEIRGEIQTLKSETISLKRGYKIARNIAITAVIIGLIMLFWRIWDNIKDICHEVIKNIS